MRLILPLIALVAVGCGPTLTATDPATHKPKTEPVKTGSVAGLAAQLELATWHEGTVQVGPDTTPWLVLPPNGLPLMPVPSPPTHGECYPDLLDARVDVFLFPSVPPVALLLGEEPLLLSPDPSGECLVELDPPWDIRNPSPGSLLVELTTHGGGGITEETLDLLPSPGDERIQVGEHGFRILAAASLMADEPLFELLVEDEVDIVSDAERYEPIEEFDGERRESLAGLLVVTDTDGGYALHYESYGEIDDIEGSAGHTHTHDLVISNAGVLEIHRESDSHSALGGDHGAHDDVVHAARAVYPIAPGYRLVRAEETVEERGNTWVFAFWSEVEFEGKECTEVVGDEDATSHGEAHQSGWTLEHPAGAAALTSLDGLDIVRIMNADIDAHLQQPTGEELEALKRVVTENILGDPRPETLTLTPDGFIIETADGETYHELERWDLDCEIPAIADAFEFNTYVEVTTHTRDVLKVEFQTIITADVGLETYSCSANDEYWVDPEYGPIEVSRSETSSIRAPNHCIDDEE